MNLQDWQLERQLTVLAVSGGVDSMVLLHVFHELKFPCVVAHLNFGLRGSESDGDTNLVIQTCKELSIPCFVKHVDTEKFAEENNLSIQMAARQIRYGFFQEILEGQNANYIATAHHQDDELENFFIYLLRNQLQTAWNGIPMQRGNIIRPFLKVSSDLIRNYALKNAVNYRDDSSNASTKYLRNKIRHLLIPDLKNEYELVADDFQIISELSRKISDTKRDAFQLNWENQVLEKGHSNGMRLEEFIIPTEFYENQGNHFGLRNKFLGMGFTNSQIDEILLKSVRTGSMWLGIDYSIFANRNGLMVKKNHEGVSEDVIIQLNANVSFGGFKITLDEIDIDSVNFKDSQSYYFCPTILKEELYLRSWKSGDKIQPLGMKGSKKLSDIFVDNKVDNHRKSDFPVLTSNGKIHAVLGLKRSADFLLGDSKTAIKISWDTLN